MLAESGVEMSKKLGGAAKHTAREFVMRLVNVFTQDCADKSLTAAEDTGAFDWKTLGSAQHRHFFTAAAASFMNGPMDAQVKVRAAAQRNRKEALGPVAAPDAVDDTTAEQQTDHAMKRMVKVMKERRAAKTPLSMEQLAANPTSFAQFVENMFTLSFLVKDGEAGLAPSTTHDDNPVGNALVERKRKPEENMDVERATFVMHLDVKGWRALTKQNGNMGGAMPHREDDDDDADADGVELDLASSGVRTNGGMSRNKEGSPVDDDGEGAETRPEKSTGKGKKWKAAPPQDVTNSQDSTQPRQRRRTANA